MKKFIGVIVVVLLVAVGVAAGMYLGGRTNNTTANTQNGNVNNSQGVNSKITLEEAKAIALKEAGLTDAVFTKAKEDFENGRAAYEIEFKNDVRKWEYDIDAATGKVLSFDIDELKINMTGNDKIISQTEAEDIAFKAAGVTKDSTKYLKSEIDREDGKTVYEVEFLSDKGKCEYKIDAVTGEILSAELN